MKKITAKFWSIVICVFVVAAIVSCKEDTECEAVIKVTTFANKAVPNAKVKLYLEDKNGEQDVRATGTTDGSGTFKTTFPLEMVLSIEAKDSLNTALGTIKLESGKTVKSTVYMQPNDLN